jgi:hypothetical protein
MNKYRAHIIFLITSIFFIKVALCIGTLYFQCNNDKLMNSLIMQVEIEHEDSSNENIKDAFAKEAKFTKHSILGSFNTHNLELNNNSFIDFSDLYPLNSSYTDVFTPPPKA